MMMNDNEIIFNGDKRFNKDIQTLWICLFGCTVLEAAYVLFNYDEISASVINVSVSLYIVTILFTMPAYIINNRKITLSKKGMRVSAWFIDKFYSWEEIKTCRFENIEHYNSYLVGGTAKYPGVVFCCCKNEMLRKKHRHPYQENLLHPLSMFCIYSTPKDETVFVRTLWSKGSYAVEDFSLYEEGEETLRDMLNKWGVKLTYDYRKDYYNEWNSRAFERVVDSVILTKKKANGHCAIVAWHPNTGVLGIWFEEDGFSDNSVIEALCKKAELHEVFIDYELSREEYCLLNKNHTDMVFVIGIESLEKQISFGYCLEIQNQVHRAIKRMLKSRNDVDFYTRAEKLSSLYDGQLVSIADVKNIYRLYKSVLNKPFKIKKMNRTITLALLRTGENDDNYRSRIVYDILSKTNAEEKEFLWQLGQQAYFW